MHAQGLVGASIRIPSEHASAEEHAAFRAKLMERVPGLAELKADDPAAFRDAMRTLGAPEDAKGYKLPEFEPPEGVNLAPVDGFAEWAAEQSLTQAQFEGLARKFTEQQIASAEAKLVQHNAAMEQLRSEWGYAFDDKLAAATNMAKLAGGGAPPDMVEALEAGRVNPDVLRWFAKLAEGYGNEADMGENRNAHKGELTPAEADLQLSEIMNNREHPYWRAPQGSKEKERALAEVMRLRERSMGKGSRAPAATFGAFDNAED